MSRKKRERMKAKAARHEKRSPAPAPELPASGKSGQYGQLPEWGRFYKAISRVLRS